MAPMMARAPISYPAISHPPVAPLQALGNLYNNVRPQPMQALTGLAPGASSPGIHSFGPPSAIPTMGERYPAPSHGLGQEGLHPNPVARLREFLNRPAYSEGVNGLGGNHLALQELLRALGAGRVGLPEQPLGGGAPMMAQ